MATLIYLVYAGTMLCDLVIIVQLSIIDSVFCQNFAHFGGNFGKYFLETRSFGEVVATSRD